MLLLLFAVRWANKNLFGSKWTLFLIAPSPSRNKNASNKKRYCRLPVFDQDISLVKIAMVLTHWFNSFDKVIEFSLRKFKWSFQKKKKKKKAYPRTWVGSCFFFAHLHRRSQHCHAKRYAISFPCVAITFLAPFHAKEFFLS